ncbi:MAG: UDP-N-acetylmuramoyl-tripeptide--D-alanyl-D-alanine ligase [Prevotellaceae bacterium]|jgi:UDP-N-acetylmuramoyl-tripeptide--D-alanyl-D-alanine ligase|nr:UDP-N-acetylmuramoyl-tripeptide--D-alanyl-D-alanine ligase [Prevotellaceae bacterium]
MKDLYNIFLEHLSVSTDSRNVTPGDIFFALKGDNFDGKDKAQKAVEAGAAYAVIDRPVAKGERFILVPDVLEALQQLASRHREALGLPVVALTGTNGKTTTKELIAAVLSTRYKVCATSGNLNNHIGVPLTLLRMDTATEVAVVEMGANHPGEIAQLAAIAWPDYGLITNVGKAHLEGFGSLEGVMQTKGALYEVAQTLFVNADNPLLCGMAKERGGQKERHFYGLNHQKASVLPVDSAFPFLRISVPGYPLIETQLVGAYNADNVLAALAVGAVFGVDHKAAAVAISGYVPSNNRSQWKQTGKNTLIIDAYNANPTSMAAALDNFEQLQAENKVVILGDMLELGLDSEREHRILVERLVSLQKNGVIGQAFLVGTRLGNTFDTVEKLRNYLLEHPLTGATILIKGSRGKRLEQVLDVL